MTRISGVQGAMRAVREIQRTGVLRNEVGGVLEIRAVAEAVQQDISVENELANSFSRALGTLKDRAECLVAALQDIALREEPESLIVRIPDELDIKDLVSLLQKIGLALEQSLIGYTDAQLKIGHFDYGSNWIEFSLRSLTAITIMSRLILLVEQGDIAVTKAMARRVQLQELTQEARLEKEVAEQLLGTFDRKIRDEQEAALCEIANLAGVPAEQQPDYIVKLKLTMNVLSELKQKGVELHPSLTAPTEIVDVFSSIRELIQEVAQLPGTARLTDGRQGSGEAD